MGDSSTVLVRLQAHLEEVQRLSSTPLDQRLFDEAELVLPAISISKNYSYQLLRTASIVLPTLQQDPTPLVNLLVRLLEPYSFSDILAFDPPVDLAAGLAVGDHMVSYNRLVLDVIQKAALRSSDAATIATQPATVLALVKLWLCTADTGIAAQASRVLLRLLRVDREVQASMDGHSPLEGQGLVWRRVFADVDVYGAIFEACSLTGDHGFGLSKHRRTVAQARLMEWLPDVASMDWSAVTTSHHADVEAKFQVGTGGILEFAAMHMVDAKDDVLMHMCLIEFYTALITVVTRTDVRTGKSSSMSLDYLVSKGLHERSASFFLTPRDPSHAVLDVRLLYGPSSAYLAAYAETYPEHYLSSRISAQISSRLFEAFDLSPSRWAHTDSPKNDLHLLASLPRKALLPQGPSAWSSSPLSALPSRYTNPDVLNTLATVFHGPTDIATVLFPLPSLMQDRRGGQKAEESATARVLYYLYLHNNPRFWSDIVTHAETIALKDQALAAINCITAVVTAAWSDGVEVDVPMATPATGTLAMLTPPALEYTLPYLLKPARSFANLVGGRGDAESAAYRVATAKYDALRALHSRLAVQVEQEPESGFEDILATIGKRLAEGPLSREGEVGGQVATLDL